MRKFLSIIAVANALCSLAQSAGDFRSVSSGSWTSPTIWERYSSTGVWQASGIGENSPGQIPSSTNSVTVLANHSVIVPLTGTKQCKNLTVNANGKLYSNNSNVGNNFYLDVLGDIVCNGQIGNGNTYDAISINVDGSNCTISGSGVFDASRLRKNDNTNVTTNLIVARNITLHSGSTALYSNIIYSTFNVTVNANDTVFVVGDGTTAGNVSINGTNGTGTARSGTFTINGAIKISNGYATPGMLYLTSTSSGVCVFTIAANGYVEAPTLVCSASGAGGHTFNLNGYLKITDEPSAFSTPSTTKNTYNIASTSTVEYSRNANQTIYNFGTNACGNLIVSGSGTKTLNGNTSVANQLTVTSGSIATGNNNFSLGNAASAIFYPSTYISITGGTTDFNNRLVTFQSDANGSAFIASINGTLSNANNITVQKWITAQRGYRLMSHPFVAAKPLNALTGFALTGNGAGFTNAAANVYYYDSVATSGSAIKELTHTNSSSANVWSQGRGLYFLIRGKNNEGIGGVYNGSPTAFAANINGAINVGTLQDYKLGYVVGGNNFTLVGNPYLSPINIKLLQSNSGALSTNTNVSQVIYVYNPIKNPGAATALRGGYDSYVNDGNTDIIIPVMGAFFVKANASGQVIKWSENVKSTTSPLALFGNQKSNYHIQLSLENQEGLWDDVKLRFTDDGHGSAEDRADGIKLNNAFADIYSISSDNKKLCIDTRNIISLSNDTIPLGVRISSKENDFKIRLANIHLPENVKLYLFDKLSTQKILLEKTGDEYSFNITDDTTTNNDHRFALIFQSTKTAMLSSNLDEQNSFEIFPNPVHDILNVRLNKEMLNANSPIQISLFSEDGILLKSQAIKQPTDIISIKINDLNKGMMIVNIKNDTINLSKKVFKQ